MAKRDIWNIVLILQYLGNVCVLHMFAPISQVFLVTIIFIVYQSVDY